MTESPRLCRQVSCRRNRTRAGWAAALLAVSIGAGAAGADQSTLTALQQASDSLASQDETPEAAAARHERLMERLRNSPLCFSRDSTPEQLANIAAAYDMLPPGMFVGTDRFFIDNTVWAGPSSLTTGGRAQRTSLRFSFPADGIAWGNTTSPNNLNAMIVTRFGSVNSDRGRELIRQAIGSWSRYTGLTYTEVADNNGPFSFSTNAPNAGDIRIGSIPQDGVAGVLAYNVFPTAGGDMTIDSSDFVSSSLWSTSNNYRFLRNVVSHEHGHGLGFAHNVPCNNTKLMEPFAGSSFDTVQIDEIRGAQRNHGDRFAGNQSSGQAADFGNLTTPVLKSIIERNLSTNGAGGFNNTDEDWFRFTLGSAQNVVITVTPTGGSYVQGQQSSNCNGTTSTTNASQAGNLNVELRDSAGTTTLFSASSAAAGVAEVLTANGLAAGTYTVRVVDVGPNANQSVQLYDLTIRVGTSKAPPFAFAGVNKRVAAGQTCFFMGDIYSRAVEAGATLNSASYDWDLDGNGTFERLDTPQPTIVYPANGSNLVTLRVTDSNGMSSTHSITVTVSGAVSSISSLSPSSGTVGATVPITIVGVSLAGVTSSAQVSLSGSGVTITGSPVVTGGGTTVTGLSLVISPSASVGARTLMITNADGAGQIVTLDNAFTVNITPPSNDDCASPISWGSVTGPRPFSNINATTGATQSFPSTGCPAAGPIFNDVWYAWTAPLTGTLAITTDSGTASPAFSSRVAVYQGTACPPSTANLRGCDDFGLVFGFPVVEGQTYLFQVGSVFSTASGNANVILNLAPSQGACCDSAGFCTIENASNCIGTSTYQGTGTICNPTICPVPDGTCCSIDGLCTFVSRETCTSGAWAPGGACDPNPCPPPTGSCCQSDGSCIETEQPDCIGAWTLAGVCDPSPCPAPSGACCVDTACTITESAQCAGAFQGGGTVCGDPSNPTTCCKANFNLQGGVTVQDIFDFLTAFFANDPAADINGEGGVSVQDIFDFVGAFFAGCPG